MANCELTTRPSASPVTPEEFPFPCIDGPMIMRLSGELLSRTLIRRSLQVLIEALFEDPREKGEQLRLVEESFPFAQPSPIKLSAFRDEKIAGSTIRRAETPAELIMGVRFVLEAACCDRSVG